MRSANVQGVQSVRSNRSKLEVDATLSLSPRTFMCLVECRLSDGVGFGDMVVYGRFGSRRASDVDLAKNRVPLSGCWTKSGTVVSTKKGYDITRMGKSRRVSGLI